MFPLPFFSPASDLLKILTLQSRHVELLKKLEINKKSHRSSEIQSLKVEKVGFPIVFHCNFIRENQGKSSKIGHFFNFESLYLRAPVRFFHNSKFFG